MNNSYPERDEPLSEFELRLKAFQPRKPDVDFQTIASALVSLPRLDARASAFRTTTRWLGWLAASWLIGATIGGGAVYFALAGRTRLIASIDSNAAGDPQGDNSGEANQLPKIADSQPWEGRLLIDDWSDITGDGQLQVRSWTRKHSRLVSSRSNFNASEQTPWIDGAGLSTEPGNPPTRHRLMKELLN
jgi:hypothetical protein